MRRALAALVLAACGHPASRVEPSIAVAPKPVAAAPLEVVGGGRAGAAPDEGAFELAFAATQLCVRIGGRVHCAIVGDDTPLASEPALGGIEDATSLAMSNDVGCLATRRGTVHCWGSNTSAQLGAKLRAERSLEPVQVAGVTNAERVFVGDRHACATTTDGALWCWGANEAGETGGATSWAPAARELAVATQVPGLRDVVTVAITDQTTCALTKRGEVWCWGSSITPEQEKAQGSRNERPFAVAALANVEDLSGGGGAICGVRAGEVFCVGATYSLAPGLGPGSRGVAKLPLAHVRKIRLGSIHACALLRDGRVSCLGHGSDDGVLGRGAPDAPEDEWQPKGPALVPGVGSVRELVARGLTTCAIVTPDEVRCWGLWPYGRPDGAPQRVLRSPERVELR